MVRPEIIVYRSDYYNCFFVSTDNGKHLLDPADPISWEGVDWWEPGHVPDLREVWRSGHE